MKEHKQFKDIVKTERNYLLDLLKGICVIFVILHHAFLLPWAQPTYLELGFPFYVFQAIPIYLLVSGFAWTMGYEKKQINKWYDLFKPLEILRKCLRILIPFTIAFVIDFAIYSSLGWSDIVVELYEAQWWQMYLMGGLYEFGAYYILICFQLIIVIPTFYLLIKRFNWKPLLFIGGFQCLWELLRWAVNIPDLVYEFSIFNLVILPAFGIWLALNLHKTKQNIWVSIVMAAIGITMIALRFYSNLNFDAYIGNFNEISFAHLFPMALFEVLIRNFRIKHKGWGFVGRATFSFYLTQKGLFNLVFISMILHEMSYFDFQPICWYSDNFVVNVLIWIGLIAAIAIPFFYIVEALITNNINKGIKYFQYQLNTQKK